MKTLFKIVSPVVSVLLTVSVLTLGAVPLSVLAEEQAPEPIAEYIMPAELEGATKDVYLAAVTKAVAADPNNAPDITSAALAFKIEEIKNTPGLATEIMLAILLGLPQEFWQPGLLADILDNGSRVLRTLPADLSNVASDAVEAFFASLPPELAAEVRELILSGPEGALRNLVTFIFTAPPVGGEPAPKKPKKPKKEKKDKEEKQPKDKPVTPTQPQ